MLILVTDGWGIFFEVEMKFPWIYWRYVNIVSGNGLLPQGHKPLPEPMLTRIYVAIWRH